TLEKIDLSTILYFRQDHKSIYTPHLIGNNTGLWGFLFLLNYAFSKKRKTRLALGSLAKASLFLYILGLSGKPLGWASLWEKPRVNLYFVLILILIFLVEVDGEQIDLETMLKWMFGHVIWRRASSFQDGMAISHGAIDKIRDLKGKYNMTLVIATILDPSKKMDF
ncbi:hypothetical protein ACJX0J_031354, partial [Zea mays]